MHKYGKFEKIICIVHLSLFFLVLKISYFKLQDHYLTEEHQEVLLKLVRHLSNNLSNIQHGNGLEEAASQFEELNETIAILTDGVKSLSEDVERLDIESTQLQNIVDTLQRDCASINLTIDGQNQQRNEREHQLHLMKRDLAELKEEVNERELTSDDGTLVWKITNFQEKMSEI